MRSVILDTDPGIDDALAILLAIASPEVMLRGVTVTGGNCAMRDGWQNARAVLAMAQRSDIPVCAGVELPLLRPAFIAAETHGASGLGYARLPDSIHPVDNRHAVDFLIDTIMAHPGEVTLVPVAPLTNIAMAIRKEPRIVAAVRDVIIMGGAVRVDGNTTSLAEFNFYVDPHAAHIVMQSGMPMTLVPWDITRDVMLYQSHIDLLLNVNSPISQFIADATRFYLEFHQASFGVAGCAINDPVALALAFWPELAQTTAVHIDVEYTSELTMGKSVITYVGDTTDAPRDTDITGFDRQKRVWRSMHRPTPNVRLVTQFDQAQFIARFVERMMHLAMQVPSL
ncbi:MAG: nucleoside hydrolase [Roseiflexaceae bacterium]|jgi:purine nucleosidase